MLGRQQAFVRPQASDKRCFWGTMIKPVFLAAAIAATVSACEAEKLYTPTTLKLDVRTAQDEVRKLTMSGTFRFWYHDDWTTAGVGDVRFRNDGMAFLLEVNGTQITQACYYSGIDDPSVYRMDNYLVEFCTGQSVWLPNEAQARRLSDALFALKRAPR
jgi:hypothetical protein